MGVDADPRYAARGPARIPSTRTSCTRDPQASRRREERHETDRRRRATDAIGEKAVLAPQHRVQDAGAAIRAMTLLHATEPATPSTSGETRRISDVSNRSAIALRVQLFFLCDRLLDHLGFGIRVRIHVRPILSD